MERELDAPRFLSQEPFYRAHRPFKSGKRWRDLSVDVKLAQVMEDRSKSESAYLHQSEAIDELRSPTTRPVVVTTGTGSGKTEAFLLPVIRNAWEDATKFNKSGLTVILIYPMNALAKGDPSWRVEELWAANLSEGASMVERLRQSASTQ